jgi:hypothetical protein
VLAATSPPGEAQPELRALAGGDRVEVRRLEPLTAGGTADLLARFFDASVHPAFVRACETATRGNPLLLEELAQAAAEAGVAPDADGARRVEELGGQRLHRRAVDRIGRLGRDAMSLAEAVAVLGEGCELRHAGALADLDDKRSGVAARALIGAGVLADRPALGFANPSSAVPFESRCRRRFAPASTAAPQGSCSRAAGRRKSSPPISCRPSPCASPKPTRSTGRPVAVVASVIRATLETRRSRRRRGRSSSMVLTAFSVSPVRSAIAEEIARSKNSTPSRSATRGPMTLPPAP